MVRVRWMKGDRGLGRGAEGWRRVWVVYGSKGPLVLCSWGVGCFQRGARGRSEGDRTMLYSWERLGVGQGRYHLGGC